MNRIHTDMDAFFERVDAYLNGEACPDHRKDACEAAYEGLYRLMQRIEKELQKGNLSKSEQKICNDIVQEKYFKGLLELRTIATHIQSDTARKRGHITVYMPSGQPVSIDPGLSAGTVFAGPTFQLPKPDSGFSALRHADLLRNAKTRLGKLISSRTKG